MRLLLVSTHIDQTTGYSKVAYNLVQQIATLQPQVKLFHFGFQRHPARANLRKAPKGVVQFDAAAAEDPREEGFGFNKIREYIDTVNPDLVLIYNDPLIIAKFLEAVQKTEADRFKIWAYVDQLYPGIAQPLLETLDKACERIYAFTPQWAETYKAYFPAGPQSKVGVIGHAADPEVFKPLTSAKALRSELRIPDNAVVFLNCNRNTQRKRHDLAIQGFVGLLKAAPEIPAYLVVATGLDPRTGGYYDLRRIFLEEVRQAGQDLAGVADRLILLDTAGQAVYSDEAMNRLYNACDIGINVSTGEGFGLCQLEHLQTGAPQVVTDVGDYSFLEKCAVRIDTPIRVYEGAGNPLGLYGKTATPEAVTAAMTTAALGLATLRTQAGAHRFPTWAGVCEGFLEDLLTACKGSQ